MWEVNASDRKWGSRWGYHDGADLGATRLFVGLRTRTNDVYVRLCITGQTAAHCLKVCQPREGIKRCVWVKPYRQSVKHNRGCKEGHPLLFFALSPSLFHKEMWLCVSVTPRFVCQYLIAQDGWNVKTNGAKAMAIKWAAWMKKSHFITDVLLTLHMLRKTNLVVIYKPALFLMKINSQGLFVFVI